MDLAPLIAAEARRWLGTPWRHQASVRGVGCDCVGLVRGVGNALGLMDCRETNPEAARFAGYGRLPDPRNFVRALDQFLTRIGRARAPVSGDVLFMRFGRLPQHLAILTPESTIIHADNGPGFVVEHRLDPEWAARVMGVWAFRGAA